VIANAAKIENNPKPEKTKNNPNAKKQNMYTLRFSFFLIETSPFLNI
jgi:hypothetical protein